MALLLTAAVVLITIYTGGLSLLFIAIPVLIMLFIQEPRYLAIVLISIPVVIAYLLVVNKTITFGCKVYDENIGTPKKQRKLEEYKQRELAFFNDKVEKGLFSGGEELKQEIVDYIKNYEEGMLTWYELYYRFSSNFIDESYLTNAQSSSLKNTSFDSYDEKQIKQIQDNLAYRKALAQKDENEDPIEFEKRYVAAKKEKEKQEEIAKYRQKELESFNEVVEKGWFCNTEKRRQEIINYIETVEVTETSSSMWYSEFVILDSLRRHEFIDDYDLRIADKKEKKKLQKTIERNLRRNSRIKLNTQLPDKPKSVLDYVKTLSPGELEKLDIIFDSIFDRFNFFEDQLEDKIPIQSNNLYSEIKKTERLLSDLRDVYLEIDTPKDLDEEKIKRVQKMIEYYQSEIGGLEDWF